MSRDSGGTTRLCRERMESPTPHHRPKTVPASSLRHSCAKHWGKPVSRGVAVPVGAANRAIAFSPTRLLLAAAADALASPLAVEERKTGKAAPQQASLPSHKVFATAHLPHRANSPSWPSR